MTRPAGDAIGPRRDRPEPRHFWVGVEHKTFYAYNGEVPLVVPVSIGGAERVFLVHASSSPGDRMSKGYRRGHSGCCNEVALRNG
jgi:hypothetical protein